MAALVNIGFEGYQTLPKLTKNRTTWIAFLEAVIDAVDAGNFVDLSINGNLSDWDLDEPGSKTVPFEHESGVTKLFLSYDGKDYSERGLPWIERLKMYLQTLLSADDLTLQDDFVDAESDSFKTRIVKFTGSDKKKNPDV